MPRQLKLAHKIVLMAVVVALAFVAVLLIAALTGRRNQALLEEIRVAYAPAFEISRDLDEKLTALQRNLQDAAGSADPAMLDSADQSATAFRRLVAEGSRIARLRDAGVPTLARRFDAYYRLARANTERMIAGETGVEVAAALEQQRVEYNQLRAQLRALAAAQRTHMQQAFELAQENQRRSIRGITAVTVGCLLLLAALAAAVIRALKNELGQAIRVADSLAELRPGAHLALIEELPRDEIGELLRRMRHMVERVEQRTAELRFEIAERQRVEAALRESEQRYALAAAGANDGLWDWDRRAQRVYYSPRWKAMLGLGPEAASDRPEEWLDRIHELDRDLFLQQLDLHCRGVIPQLECEHRLRHADGSWRWMLARGLAVHDETGECHRVAGSLTDVTQRKQNEEQLIHDAFHDALTGLPNRALLRDRLSQALSVAEKRPQKRFAVLFIDLDRFKVVNDSVGHALGDELLRGVAARLGECVRPEDTVARMGGDEFAILLDDVGQAADAVRVCERVQQRLQAPFELDHHLVVTSASIGIALSSTGYHRPEELLRDADIAMYRAKAAGKARHEIFDSTMHARSLALLQLELDLRQARERGELCLYYQPLITLADGTLHGFEALLRWRHPQRGLVGPAEFIPMAEETGLIVPIGEWVLAEAVGQLAAWQRRFPRARDLRLAINLSPRELAHEGLPARVAAVLAAAGVAAERLSLELTEGMVMGGQSTLALLYELKRLGVQLHVDDFGTGYSSLAYLDQLPIDALKIDRSFVARMHGREDEEELVRTIVALAHNLGLSVIAEGVEEAAQAERLRQMGCDLAQGAHFASPLEAEEAALLLDERSVTAVLDDSGSLRREVT